MTVQPLIPEPGRVDEPQATQAYSALFSRVVAEGKPTIVRRNGKDLAAVVRLEQLELLREAAEQQEAEQRTAQIDGNRAEQMPRLLKEWFDDTDNPSEPESDP